MDIIAWLNTNSGASQVVLAAVLVGTTIYYAFQTRKTVRVLEKQLETGVRPIIVVDHFHVADESNKEGTYCIRSNLVNVGTGVAVNIVAEFSYTDGGRFVGRSVNAIDYLKPDGEQSSHHFHIEKKAFEHLRYTEGHHGLAAELDCTVSFQDIHGSKFKTQQMVYYTKTDRKIAPEPGTLRML